MAKYVVSCFYEVDADDPRRAISIANAFMRSRFVDRKFVVSVGDPGDKPEIIGRYLVKKGMDIPSPLDTSGAAALSLMQADRWRNVVLVLGGLAIVAWVAVQFFS